MKNMFQLLLISVLLFACANDTDVTQEMMKFDEAFVPVWYFAHVGDAQQAENHAFYLEQKWYALKNDYADVAGAEIAWEDTYNCVNELLTSALHSIEYHDTEAAAYDLEGVRFELMELRSRYDIDYYLDDIWTFQMTYDLVKELTHQQYYYREWYEFDCLVDELNYTWNDLLKAENNQLWNTNQQKQWRECRTEISILMLHYNKAIQRPVIREAVVNHHIDAIEPVLFDMIQLFGKFDKNADVSVAKI